jgi:hypothetical protein
VKDLRTNLTVHKVFRRTPVKAAAQQLANVSEMNKQRSQNGSKNGHSKIWQGKEESLADLMSAFKGPDPHQSSHIYAPPPPSYRRRHKRQGSFREAETLLVQTRGRCKEEVLCSRHIPSPASASLLLDMDKQDLQMKAVFMLKEKTQETSSGDNKGSEKEKRH